jgi:hypothetical protein
MELKQWHPIQLIMNDLLMFHESEFPCSVAASCCYSSHEL